MCTQTRRCVWANACIKDATSAEVGISRADEATLKSVFSSSVFRCSHGVRVFTGTLNEKKWRRCWGGGFHGTFSIPVWRIPPLRLPPGAPEREIGEARWCAPFFPLLLSNGGALACWRRARATERVCNGVPVGPSRWCACEAVWSCV